MEPVGQIGDVRFVNDSKATNVEAARRSIESFEGGVVAIIGGRFKGGDLRELREPLAANGRGVVAIGEAAPLVREALHDVVPVVEAASMREAVAHGYEAARRTASCCSRRRARASTGSGITPNADASSRRRWRGCANSRSKGARVRGCEAHPN